MSNGIVGPRGPDSDGSKKLERVLKEHPGLEHIITVLKTGLATTPFAGGVASLLSDYIPSARFRRLEDFARAISDDLTRLKDRVSEERIGSEPFAFAFESCFKGAAENPQKEKFAAFRAMLVNSAIPGDLSAEEEEYFIGLVGRLSVLHLRVLRFMARPKEYLADVGVPESNVRGGFGQMFEVAIPGVARDVVKSAFRDLYTAGLINTDQSIFSTMTSAQGLQLLGNRVSPLGQKFIGYCSQPG